MHHDADAPRDDLDVYDDVEEHVDQDEHAQAREQARLREDDDAAERALHDDVVDEYRPGEDAGEDYEHEPD